MKKIISVFFVILLILTFNISIYALSPPYVQRVEINADEIITMYVGDELTLEAIAEPHGFSFVYMIWDSDNGDIVTVNGDDGTTKFDPPVSSANIFALAEGIAVVTVYADLGPNPYKEEWTEHDSITINVIPKETSDEPSISIGGISFDITLDAQDYNGDIIAGLYSDDGKLQNLKTYQSKQDLRITFDKGKTGSYVKILWWKSLNSLEPKCAPQIIYLK